MVTQKREYHEKRTQATRRPLEVAIFAITKRGDMGERETSRREQRYDFLRFDKNKCIFRKRFMNRFYGNSGSS